MAGSYPDDTMPRLAYDLDGSTVWIVDLDTSATEVTGADVTDLNALSQPLDDASRQLGLAILFPGPRLLQGLFAYSDGGGTVDLSYAAAPIAAADVEDSAGWTYLDTLDLGATLSPGYRSPEELTTSQVCYGVLLANIGATSSPSDFGPVHVFGRETSEDRLAFWNPDDEAEASVALFDFGDVVPGSSEDRTFFVKNLSTSYEALEVVIATDSAGGSASPAVAPCHLFSFDGINFTAAAEIENLGPGEISPPIEIRRITPSTADLGLWPFRVTATPGGWS